MRDANKNSQDSDSRTWPACSGEEQEPKKLSLPSYFRATSVDARLFPLLGSFPSAFNFEHLFLPRQHRICQHGHESERGILGKQIKATGSAYSGTLMLPSALVTTACTHNYQINRNLKRHFYN